MRTLLAALSLLFLIPALPAPAMADGAGVEAVLGSEQDTPVRYYRYRKIRRVRRYPTNAAPVRHPRRASVDPRSSVYIGFGGLGDFNVETENELTRILRSGGGFDLFLGFRANQYFALEFGYVATIHSTSDDISQAASNGAYERGVLHGVTLDAKIFLIPKSRRIEPYVQVGGGGYAFVQEGFSGMDLGGGGFHLGGGVDIRFNRSIALGLRALYKGLYLDNSDPWYLTTESAFFNQLTLGANLQLHF
ncbi:MAG: outer membrane beta-barrel protein [Pseudomonadota bacterium]